MDSLFKNVLKSKSSIYNREQLIKQTIIDTLLGNIKEIQYDLKENQNDDARKGVVLKLLTVVTYHSVDHLAKKNYGNFYCLQSN